MVSASSQTPHLAEESEDWCVDNYWSTVVAVVVVTVSAAVVLLWCCQMLAGGMLLLRLCWRACARSARPGTGQWAPDIGQHSAVRGGRAEAEQ